MAIFSRRTKGGPVAGRNGVRAGPAEAGLEARTTEIGRDLLDRARSNKAGLLSARFYSDKLMDWSMKDHDFKVQLFRFVDAFPVLTTPELVHEHLVDYLTQPGVRTPPGMDLALRAGGVAKGLAAKTISSQIKGMAENFIAGTDAADALPGLRKLWGQGVAFSVDLLGEACVSDDEADMYKGKYLDLVENLHGEASGWDKNERRAPGGRRASERLADRAVRVASDTRPDPDCTRACEMNGGFPCQEELILALNCLERGGCLGSLGRAPCERAAVPYTECLSGL